MLKSVRSTIYLTVFLFLVNNFCWSQNIAPTLTATGNQYYCAKSQIKIVTDFDIVDPDDTEIEALFIQISTGYIQGEDSLTLTGSHSSILTSWSATQGKLTLFGVGSLPVSYTELVAATKDIVFQSTSNNPIDKAFSITIGDANYLPSTNHYYEYVPAIGITWTSAKIAAENRFYFELQGYLATITLADEAQLSGEQAAGAGWIGGSDAETEGVWKWVTGPEIGTIFWNGLSNGSTPNYANWNNNEPNQFQGREENYAHITVTNNGIRGSWNDLTNTGDANGNYQPKGYIVEYGGLPGDPNLNISASTNIYTTLIVDSKSASRCGSGSLTLEATASQGDVLWFDSLARNTPIFNGQSFTTPTINSTTTYYALASENGCTDGLKVAILATVFQIPTITSVSDDLVCDSGSGTLSATSSIGSINWYNDSVGGASLFSGTTFTTPVVNISTTYYIDATANGCTTATRTPIILTVQKTAMPTTANSNQVFCDIDQATILNLMVSGNDVNWYTSSIGGTPLSASELLQNNTTYYGTQTINSCESINRLLVNANVFETVVTPSTSSIQTLKACDSMLDGDDENGYTTFDLTANESILLNGKAESNYSFNYFTDPTYTTQISTANNNFINTVKGEQTIYVRISNIGNNSCFTDTSFDVRVNKLPTIQDSTIFKNCDEDGTPDGFTDFNLDEVINSITNNDNADLTITFYKSFNDAETTNNQIASIFNNQNANTVYARVENVDGCHRVATINLEVSTTSFPSGYYEEIALCDDDNTNDGYHIFDLTQVTPLFISQFPTGQNLSVHYFENVNDAQLEQNEIFNQKNYINTEVFSQTLFVRVESDDNGTCFGIGPHLVLTVRPRPEFEVDNSEIYCLDNNPISLTTFNPNGNYSYEWEDSFGNIVSNSPIAVVTSSGSYTVIASSSFGCKSFPVKFSVVESAKANIEIDDITIVELSDNNSVTINNDANNLGIGDYEFSLDMMNGPFQNDPYFDNVGAGSHTIYVKDKNGCGIATLEIFILGFPKFFTPNNDGANDTWQIEGLGTDFTNASKVSVYNRYGKLVKQLNAKVGIWDGSFNGQKLPDSDYWFVAELIEVTGNIKTYRGHFTLKR